MAAVSPHDIRIGNLSSQDIKILDHTRQRLAQLTNSLATLQQQILNSDPLPPWSSLNSVAQIISQNLASVSSHLTKNADVLSSIAVYPLSNYPGRDQGALLSQLLRKKLEPYVEDWVEEGRAVGADLKDREEFTELWEWAMMAANEEARKHEWDGAEYTLEEKERGVEHVVTGLKKGIYEEDSSEDEDDDGKEEEGKGAATAKLAKEQATVQRPMAIDELLRFLVKGEAALK